MRTTIENWQGTDAELLAELNAPSVKVVTPNPYGKPGRWGMKGVATVSPDLSAMFMYTLQSASSAESQAVLPDTNPPEPDHTRRAKAVMISGFLMDFQVGVDGIDFANEQIRSSLTEIMTQSGWEELQIAFLLGLGYVMKSQAEIALGRAATQQDVDDVREIITTEQLQSKWKDLFHAEIQPALTSGNKASIVSAIRSVADSMEE